MRRASIWKAGAAGALGLLASVPAIAQAPAPAPAPPAPASAPAPNRAATPSNLPYDVTADNGEVFNDERRAVYTGNVVVIQGQDRLHTPKLTIFFAKKDPSEKPKTPAPGAPTATSTFGKVERMEAEGTVYFDTPTQNAKGDHGTYLASDDTTTLIGNVILVQNKDVSTGDKLVINRTNDHYTLFSKAGAKERVRGVFYQDEPATPAPGQPAPAGAAPKPAKPAKAVKAQKTGQS